MLTILEDLWLDNWYQSILLANRAVSCQRMSSLADGSFTWTPIANLKNSSPFCKSASQFIVLSASLAKSIESLGCSLSIGSTDWHETCVDLDTAVDSSSSEDLGEFLGAVSSGVPDSLIKHDDAANVLLDTRCREKKLTISLSVGVVVLDADSVESLSDGAGGLVSCEDSLARGADLLGSLDELLFEVT